MVIAMVLALFSLGGFYAAGLKKGAMLFFGLWILGLVLMQVSDSLLPIVTIASFYITYKWTKEHNDAVEGNTTTEAHV